MIKRIICLALLFSLCLSLPACHQQEEKIQVPVNFYYPRTDTNFGTADSLISPITAEGRNFTDDPIGLLNFYLQGQTGDNRRSPFPADTQILSMEQINGIVRITLSSHFATLTGLELTIACACLTLTVLDLTGGNSLRISVPGTTLNGAEYIRMDRNCLNLLDVIPTNS